MTDTDPTTSDTMMVPTTVAQTPFLTLTMDPLDWLAEFSTAAKANQWSDARTVLMAPLRMHVDLRTPFMNNGNITNLETFEAAFKERFQTREYIMKAKQAAQEYFQGENESFNSLVAKMDAWFRRAGITHEEWKMTLIYNAMDRALFKEVIRQNPKDYNELVRIGRTEDMIEQAAQNHPTKRRSEVVQPQAKDTPQVVPNNPSTTQDAGVDALIDQMEKLSWNQVQAALNAYGRFPNIRPFRNNHGNGPGDNYNRNNFGNRNFNNGNYFNNGNNGNFNSGPMMNSCDI
ncbi:hypothetical protein B0O80DRAFT_420691 [Mortierella sp. GBAus27b]|nr:hypothetical protein BGX31_004821 [Mortierella sp. GBA43]KAI8362844.1 hypothetical protein B0O80DRAFT_420691 [Mortierella sp. GBAus27b]